MYETRAELRKAVEGKVGQLSHDQWLMAKPDRSPPYDAADLKEVVSAVKGTGRVSATKAPRSAAAAEAAWCHARAESSRRANQQSGLVHQVRFAVFQRSDPPFPTWDQAVSWLLEERRNQGPPMASATMTNLSTGQQRLWHGPYDSPFFTRSYVLSVAPPVAPWLWRWSPVRPYLECPGADGGVARIPVAVGGNLDRLQEGSFELAKRIGCWPSKATAHILTGEVPVIAPAIRWIHADWDKAGGLRPRVFAEPNFDWVPDALLSVTRNLPLDPVADVLLSAAKNAPVGAFPQFLLRPTKDGSHTLRPDLEQWLRGKGRTRRRPAPASAELAAFVEATPDLTWEERRLRWNREHPERTYTLANDLQVSYKRYLADKHS